MQPVHMLYKELSQSPGGGILRHTTKWPCLENKSAMTQITVFPALSSSSTIKSIDVSLQGAVGLATVCNSPGGLPGSVFIEAHIGYVGFYVLLHSWPPKLSLYKVKGFYKS